MSQELLALLQQGDPICESLESISPTSLNGTSITLLVLCSILCFTCVLGNVITILTICLHKELQSSSNILLAFLSGLDLFTGLTVLPILIAYHASNLTNPVDCVLFFSAKASITYIVALSFLTLGLVTADRYLAIFKALRYREIVTPKRVTYTVFICWSIYIIFLATLQYIDLHFCKGIVKITLTITAVLFFTFCLYVYGKLFFKAREHKNAIAAQENAIQHMARGEQKQERRQSLTTFLLTGAFIACLVPELCSVIMRIAIGFNAEFSVRVYVWADFFMVLNSTLNTVIYFWRNSKLRNCALNMLGLEKRNHLFELHMDIRLSRQSQNAAAVRGK